MKPNPKLFIDFVRFSQRQYDSLDYDPFHPVLAFLQRGMSEEEALWSSTLYMAFYNIGSSHLAFLHSEPLKLPPKWALALPVGVQRRNLRGGLIEKHLQDFIRQAKAAGSIRNLLTYGFGKYEGANWHTLKHNVGSIWGNGRWSTFTTSELYQKVNKLPALPVDIGNDGSTGPRSGLCHLYGWQEGLKAPTEQLDALANKLFQRMRLRITTKIPYLSQNHYDHAMLESQLCDFNSLRKGRYYVGRDIDRDQERIVAAEVATPPSRRKLLAEVWTARKAVFDRKYLGEFNGWNGRTEYANRFYQKTGIIADHMEIRAARGGLY